MTPSLLTLLLIPATLPAHFNALSIDSGSETFPDSIEAIIPELNELRLVTGSPRSVREEWTLEILGKTGKGISFNLLPLIPDNSEDLYRKAKSLRLTLRDLGSGNQILQTEICNGIDLAQGENIWMLVRNGTRWTLRGGSKGAATISEFEYPPIDLSMIRFPSAGTPPPEGVLTLRGEREYTPPSPHPQGLPEKENTPLEGEWKIYDRGFDEEKLQPGGDYILGLRPSSDGTASWDLIYLSGAGISPGQWKPGDLKGKLYPSGFRDVYNVMWLDSERTPLSREIKAQYDTSTGLLTIQFPYWDSSMRLGRIRSF